MKIPEHIVEQIRQQSDIVEVVGEVVQLRQRGRNYIGLCPFHGEKTPSFNVSPDRGIYKCFGCGKGGNVFSFLMEYHKMSFVDAVKSLAHRLGVSLPENDDDSNDGGEYGRYEAVYALLREAANFYFKTLASPAGQAGADYVRRRAFQEVTVKEFGLGYSPDQWQGLIDEMRKQGFTDEVFVDAGLAVKRDNGGLYDRFRGRLMFPIQNAMGRVVGFGARILKDEPGQPKYINSPQSLVYDKSKVLYGIFQAKEAIRREGTALLVEGYADLLSLYQAGFRNVVASSGTALTREQLQLVGRYGKKLIIVYDGDFAGANAALRGLELALEEGFDVRIARLPEGEDPDSLVRNRGVQAVDRVLSESLSFVDFKGEMLKAQGALATPEGQAEAVRSLVESIAKVPDHIRRDFMIRAVAFRFELNEQLLYTELSQLLRRRNLSVRPGTGAIAEPPPGERSAEQPVQKHTEPTAQASQQPTKTAEPAAQIGADLLPEERELLYIMLKEPKSVLYVRQKYGVSTELFISDTGQRLCSKIFSSAEQHRTSLEQAIINQAEIDNDDTGRRDAALLSEILVKRVAPSTRWKEFGVTLVEDALKIIEESIVRLQISRRERALRSIEQQLRHRDEGAETQLLHEYGRIRAELDSIRAKGLRLS